MATATGDARQDDRIFVQNTATATSHRTKRNEEGHTLCGWRFSGARKRGAGPPFRSVQWLANLPSGMICERCMPTEKALAANVGIMSDDVLSCDE